VAEIVAAAGAPHTPVFPELAARDTEQGQELRTRYGAVADVVADSDPEVLVLLTCDHINTYFLDAWPTFAVVLRDSVTGPNDVVPGFTQTEIPLDERTANGLHSGLLRRDFDLTRSAPPSVDHSVVVPLHFINPGRIPVVLVYLNGMVPPLPSADRCRALGSAIRAALADLPQSRAAVIASGSFSLEVGGPRADPDLGYGIPDAPWAGEVAQLLRTRDTAGLAARATAERISGAGTVAGEVLPWLVAAEAASGLGTVAVDHRAGEGHAFATWR